MTGVATTNIDSTSFIDEFLGNRDGSTVRAPASIIKMQLAAEVAGPNYETRDELYADLDWAEGVLSAVWGDGIEARRGVYRKVGASGAGSWSRIGSLPIASFASAALAAKAPLDSPEFTGSPTGPTPPGGNNTTRLATTAFVQAALAALVNAAPGALDTLNELAAALGNDPNFATTILTAISDEITARHAAENLGSILRLTGSTGTAQAVTALVDAAQYHVGLEIGQRVQFRWLENNTGPGAKLIVSRDGVETECTIKRRDGSDVAAGDLSGSTRIDAVVHATGPHVLRLTGATAIADINGLSGALGALVAAAAGAQSTADAAMQDAGEVANDLIDLEASLDDAAHLPSTKLIAIVRSGENPATVLAAYGAVQPYVWWQRVSGGYQLWGSVADGAEGATQYGSRWYEPRCLLPDGPVAPLASPAFTGNPTAPDPAPGVETAQIATARSVAEGLRDAALTTDALSYTTSGQVNNGGALYESGRGISVPAGYTGRTSYRRWQISGDDLVDLIARAGETVEFTFEIETSVGLADETPITLRFATLDGAVWTNSAAAVTIVSETGNQIIGRARYTILGTEDALAPWAQVDNDAAVRSSDGHFAITEVRVSWPLRHGANGAFEWRVGRAIDGVVPGMIATVVDPQVTTLTDRIAQAEITSGPLSYTTEGQTNGGAVVSNGGLTLTVPTGQTGATAYRRAVAVMDPPAAPGQAVRFRLALTTSPDVLTQTPMTVRLAVRHGSTLDSYAATGVITSLDSTHLLAEVEYTLVGDETRFDVWYQISNVAAVRTTDGTITMAAMTFALASGADSPTEADKMLDYRVARALSAVLPDVEALSDRVSQAEITSGQLGYTTSGGQSNGAVIYDSGRGVSVPTGQTGATSYRRWHIGADELAELVSRIGETVDFTFVIETSDGFTTQSPVTLNFSTLDGAVWSNNAAPVTVISQSATEIVCRVRYTILGTEDAIAPWVQIGGSAAVRTGDGYFAMGAFWFALVAAGDLPTTADLMLGYRIDKAIAAIPGEVAEVAARGAVYTKAVDVAADGSGDYLDLTTAFAAEGGGTTAARRVLYRLHEGIYTDINVAFPDFVDVVGIGRRDHIWYRGELPADVDPAQVPLNETFNFDRTSTIRNLRVSCRNMRYPIHSESGDSANRAVQQVVGCLIENYGSQDVIDYQVGLGNPAPTLWGSAMGCGGHSGLILRSKDTIWRAPLGPFFVHSNTIFDEPMEVTLEGGAAINTRSGHAVSLKPAGAGVITHVNIIGADLAGPVEVDSTAWLTTDPDLQWGNRLAEFVTTVRACGPVLARGINGASVLELRSAAGAGSSVVVSGAAAPILFGGHPDYRAGAADHAGRVYSQHAVTGTAAGVTLAERLGDRSGAPLTLTVAFDGGSALDLVLSADYTGMSNAAVVAALNSALADGSRGFYLSDPYSGGACVRLADYDREVNNIGSATIKRGAVVAQDGSRVRARVATSTDPAWRILGIALEDIIPGAAGRVRGKGALIDRSDVLFDGSPSITEGDLFGVSASTPGAAIEGAATPILRAIWTNGYTAFEIC